jgi:vanillate O-demethylase monooxygenase subunit
MGRVVGERIQCGYHGAQFAPDGQCVLVPGQSSVPAAARVRSYPVRERYGFVWVWMGDPERATGTVPGDLYAFVDDGRWNAVDGYKHIACNYELVNDNLADITHVEFVHPSTLGTEEVRAAREGQAPRAQAVHRFDATPVTDGIDFLFFAGNTRIAPAFEAAYRRVRHANAGDLLDFLLDFRFRAPSLWVFTPTTTRAGEPPERGVRTSSPIAITPEDTGTCHYFYRTCQDYAPDDRAETEWWHEQTSLAFDEDKAVLEAQQANAGAGGVSAAVSFQGDGMGYQIRRMLRARLAAEGGQPGVAG